MGTTNKTLSSFHFPLNQANESVLVGFFSRQATSFHVSPTLTDDAGRERVFVVVVFTELKVAGKKPQLLVHQDIFFGSSHAFLRKYD